MSRVMCGECTTYSRKRYPFGYFNHGFYEVLDRAKEFLAVLVSVFVERRFSVRDNCSSERGQLLRRVKMRLSCQGIIFLVFSLIVGWSEVFLLLLKRCEAHLQLAHLLELHAARRACGNFYILGGMACNALA